MCVGAITLLAVSCYDDSALRGDLEGLENKVDGLESRLDSLEKKLNSEIKSLNKLIADLNVSKIVQDVNGLASSVTDLIANLDALDGELDGYIKSNDEALAAAIEEYKKADKALADVDTEILASLVNIGVNNVAKNENGDVVLTFVDGSELVIPSNPAEGLVTIVEEEGVKYWAVVLEDGTTQKLDVEVGHQDLKFQVNADTDALEYSVDGGQNWIPTGAVVTEPVEVLFTDFFQGTVFDEDLYEDVPLDYYTLVFDGEEYYLPLYKVDESVATIRAGKTYFTYGESKAIEVALKDIKNCYVMTKPDGWRANLKDMVLTVTAPAEAAITAGTAEAEGEVLLHCSTTDGKCKIARLAVATTQGFSLTVEENGNVTIINPIVVTNTNRDGEEITNFQEAYIGFADVPAFEADPAAYVASVPNDYDLISFTLNVWKDNTMDYETQEFTIGGRYEPGVYEVDRINTTVSEMYEYATYGETIEVGSRFVVWACPVDEKGQPVTDDLVFGYYEKPITATIKATEGGISFNDVEVNIEVLGATSFYVGMIDKEYTYGFPIDDYMQHQEGPFGYFQMAIQYGMLDYAFNYMGTLYEDQAEILTVNAADICGAYLLPETEFYMWVFPIVDGLAFEEYTYEDNLKPYIYNFTTSGISEGGALVADFGEPEITYTSIHVPIIAENYSMIYYDFYEVDEFNGITDLAADLMENGFVSGEEGLVARDNNLKPGVTKVLAALVVDQNGLYGTVESETFTTIELEYSDTFVASVGTPVFEANGTNYKVTMPVTVTGGEAAKYYYYWSTNARTEEQLQTLPLKDYYSYYERTEIPQLTYYSSNDSYQFAVVVESTDGELAAPVIVTVTKPEATE